MKKTSIEFKVWSQPSDLNVNHLRIVFKEEGKPDFPFQFKITNHQLADLQGQISEHLRTKVKS